MRKPLLLSIFLDIVTRFLKSEFFANDFKMCEPLLESAALNQDKFIVDNMLTEEDFGKFSCNTMFHK